jgi:hypothetical protein
MAALANSYAVRARVRERGAAFVLPLSLRSLFCLYALSTRAHIINSAWTEHSDVLKT